jgi:urate oxidase
VKALLEGGPLGRAFTVADNSAVVATDSIKNIVNVMARKHLDAQNEPFGIAIARLFLDRYPQVERANITVVDTRWQRLSFDGQPHDHSFTLVSNGKPFARIRAQGRHGDRVWH